MLDMKTSTYEKIYFSLWELSQRYSQFTSFRVIGNSHDQRMIPMLEVGTGHTVLFCVSGMWGTEQVMPELLVKLAEEYCIAYESQWILENFYDTKDLLDTIRICFIPVINPDGYEIYQKGYSAIKNPIHRQMLKMQNIPEKEYKGNARGVNIGKNFPAAYMKKSSIYEEPSSENETKALIHIFQEYENRGLMMFRYTGKRIIFYQKTPDYLYNKKCLHLVRNLQKYIKYPLERGCLENYPRKISNTGSIEQFYADVIKQPSLLVELSQVECDDSDKELKLSKKYKEIKCIPLEYIFSLKET